MPDWKRAIRERLAALNLDAVREAEMVEELSAHLDDRYRELLADGESEPRAAAGAIEELESQRALARRLRHTRLRTAVAPRPIGRTTGGSMFAGISNDWRVALRMIRLRPGFSAAVIGMLAIGIAGNAAIFSIFNGVFLRPLPFAEPERLVDLNEKAPSWNLDHVSISNPDYDAWSRNNRTFDGMAFFGSATGNLTGAGAAQRVRIANVTHGLLDVFGLKPRLGRNFLPEEDRKGGPHVAMLSFNLWTQTFSADPNAIGRSIKVNDEAYAVIGVLPREAVIPPDTDLWTPLAVDVTRGGSYYLNGVGRLKRGVAIQQAVDDLTRVHKTTNQKGEKLNEATWPILEPLPIAYIGPLPSVTRILLAAVGVVLLIACVNIAGLMLVRGEGRSREIAIRTAVGASRAAVVRQFLTESLLLAAIGAALGVGLGKLASEALVSMMPQGLPVWVKFDFDGRFALFCVAVTGAAAAIFGMAPALQAAAVDTRGCLQEAARSTLTRGRRAVLSSLVIIEIALASVLLAGSGLLLQAFRKVLHVDPGFRAQNVLTWTVQLPNAKYPKPEQRTSFYRNLVDRMKSLPGVQQVSAATVVPLGGHQGYFYEAENGKPRGPNEKNPVILRITALAGYFDAMGMTFVEGRGFDARDERLDADRAVIVNETFARQFFGTTHVAGKRVRAFGAPKWSEIAGVIHDVRHYGLDLELRPCVFVSLAEDQPFSMTFAAHSASDPQPLTAPMRDLLRQADPDLPMFAVRTMEDRMQRSLWVRRAYSTLFAVFGAVAILLAAAGIYGVISFGVSQRRREIGIRMALGARPGQVMSTVLRSGMALVGIGVVIGVIAAQFTGSLLSTLLFGVSPRDVGTYGVVLAGIVLIGLAANYVPARRASKVDPMGALRAE